MVRGIAFYADHFRVIRAADDDDVAVLSGGTGGQFLHSRDEWASRVDDLCGLFFQFFLHLRCDAVGSDDSRFAPLYLNRFLDGRNTLVSRAAAFPADYG